MPTPRYPETAVTGAVRAIDRGDNATYLLCPACYIDGREDHELSEGVPATIDADSRCDVCWRWLLGDA